jgi:GntR family histidine utilization transcriptional repressor
VAPEKPQSALLEIVSIAEEIRRRGGVHTSEVHRLQAEPAPAEVAKNMHLPPRSAVFHAVLVHFDRGIPVQLADRYVNPAVAPHFLEQDFTRATPSEYLLRIAPLTAVEHVIEAVLPDITTRKLLRIDGKTPCLVLHRTTWSEERVATRSRFFYPGPRYRLAGRFTTDGNGRRPLV